MVVDQEVPAQEIMSIKTPSKTPFVLPEESRGRYQLRSIAVLSNPHSW